MTPQDLAKLAAFLRASARGAKHHFTLDGRQLVAIVVDVPSLDKFHQAADLIDPPADTEGHGL